MSKSFLLVSGLALLIAAPALAVLTPTVEESFKASDYESLGKLFQNYVKARSENKGVDKASDDIKKELDKIKKRVDRDPLMMTADLGKAVWFSYEYDKQSKIKRGKVDTVEMPAYFDEKAKLKYAVWLPAKYNPKQPYPLLLCIPDKGEKPDQHLTEKWIDPAIRDGAILIGVPMPAEEKLWLEPPDKSREAGSSNLLSVFGQVSRTYAIDFDRVYVVGRGLGVEAALTFGSRSMDRFAGIIGRSGDAPKELPVENLKNLPIFLAGAGANATALKERLEKLGYDNMTRKDDAQEPEIWSWIQGHPRIANPMDVVLYPSFPDVTRAYWLEAVPTDATGEVYMKAKIDRPSNTITVEGEGISKFVLYFNDVLVDMDKPVKVVCNGTEQPLSTTPRALLRVLDFIYFAKNDPGKFYTANRQYDLPPKPKPPK